MNPSDAKRPLRRPLVWCLMLIAGGLAFLLFYGQFLAATPVSLLRPLNAAAIVFSAVFAILVGWGVGVLLTGMHAVFIPANRCGAALILVDPSEDAACGRRFTLAHCPRCAYERRGLAIDAPCPECAEPAPRVHTLPARGSAVPLHGTCALCGRALRKAARSCEGCKRPVQPANRRSIDPPGTRDAE